VSTVEASRVAEADSVEVDGVVTIELEWTGAGVESSAAATETCVDVPARVDVAAAGSSRLSVAPMR